MDFVAQNGKGTTYFQVALSVRDEKTLERELRSLRAIKDHYPKILLTMDDDPEVHYDGIRQDKCERLAARAGGVKNLSQKSSQIL